LRAALPRAAVSLLLRPDWHEPALERTAEMLGMACALLPLTPRALQALITRPAAPAAPARLPQASVPAPCAAQPLPLHVLLVEDNPVNQQVASAFLAMVKLEVEIAENGLEAVERLKQESFDAVLMDMQMPEMDGLTATRLIRAMPRHARLPIIAMTAGAMERDVQDCLAAGMNAHVSKPIDPRQLVRTLLAWISPFARGAARGR